MNEAVKMFQNVSYLQQGDVPDYFFPDLSLVVCELVTGTVLTILVCILGEWIEVESSVMKDSSCEWAEYESK